MDRSVIKDNHHFLLYFKKNLSRKSTPARIDGFLRRKTFILISLGHHAKDIESFSFCEWNIDILILEQSSVGWYNHWYIHDFHRHNKILFYLCNQGFQVLAISLSCSCMSRAAVWAFFYPPISCTYAPIKRLEVISLAFFQASHVFEILWQFSFIALRDASSLEQYIIDLWPWRGRVSKPLVSFSL